VLPFDHLVMVMAEPGHLLALHSLTSDFSCSSDSEGAKRVVDRHVVDLLAIGVLVSVQNRRLAGVVDAPVRASDESILGKLQQRRSQAGPLQSGREPPQKGPAQAGVLTEAPQRGSGEETAISTPDRGQILVG
jgi:hypothetical protein